MLSSASVESTANIDSRTTSAPRLIVILPAGDFHFGDLLGRELMVVRRRVGEVSPQDGDHPTLPLLN
jgi:hypothetical protein